MWILVDILNWGRITSSVLWTVILYLRECVFWGPEESPYSGAPSAWIGRGVFWSSSSFHSHFLSGATEPPEQDSRLSSFSHFRGLSFSVPCSGPSSCNWQRSSLRSAESRPKRIRRRLNYQISHQQLAIYFAGTAQVGEWAAQCVNLGTYIHIWW